MPAKRYHIVWCAGYIALVLGLGTLLYLVDVDTFGLWFVLGLIGLFSTLAVYHFAKARATQHEAMAYTHPAAAPPELQQQWYRRLFWAGLIAFPALSVMVAWDLYLLETGRKERVMVPEPVSFIYKSLGLIPALAVVPLFGLFCLAVIHFLFRRSQRETEDRSP